MVHEHVHLCVLCTGHCDCHIPCHPKVRQNEGLHVTISQTHLSPAHIPIIQSGSLKPVKMFAIHLHGVKVTLNANSSYASMSYNLALISSV